MFIRQLDFLSPPITLYYKGENSHSSIFAGIITIIVYSICLTFGIFYAIQFINKSNPQVCYYNRYIEDAGEFPVNSSSMFNFVQIVDTEKNIPIIVDFDLITIIGIEETIDIYQENNDLTLYNHWLYGNCNNSTDIVGINSLIKFEHFTESACIRKYYNKDDKKYYNTNEKKFRWPKILHGSSHPNRTFYGVIVEKCRNTTLKLLSDGKHCKSKEEIISYIKANSVNFLLIDQFTDILNYTTPYRKYFYSISNGLFEESYTTNHLNLNPTKLISDEGTFFESKKETLSYFFDLNEKVTSSSGDSGIYVAFYFWMQNRMQYYERVYEKVQDVLSDVGGLCSIVLTIAELINNLVNQYLTLFDTQTYMNELENTKIYDKNIFRINSNKNPIQINYRKNEEKLFLFKNLNPQTYQNDNSSSKKIGFKDEIDIYNREIKPIKIKRKKTKNKTIGINKSMKYYLRKTLKNEKNIKNTNNESSKRRTINSLPFQTFFKENSKDKSDSQSIDNIKNNIINHESNNSNDKIKKDKLKFRHYLAYILSLSKYHSNIRIYSDFRIKMISEENLILSNLNINRILKKYKDESTIIKEELENTPKLNFNNE